MPGNRGFAPTNREGEWLSIEGTRFTLFMGAAVVLALTPRPGILYVLGRPLHGGRRVGVLSALGTFVGVKCTLWQLPWVYR